MYKKVNPWQAAALLCLGTISYSAISMAAETSISKEQAQQNINQSVNQAAQSQEKIVINAPPVNPGVDKSIVQEMRQQRINEAANAPQRTNETNVGSSSSINKGSNAKEQTLYPAFSKEEILAIAEQANQSDVMPEEPVVVDPVAEEKDQMEFIEKNAELYRHIGPNPVYTYGKDEQGNGACVGTKEMCDSSQLMWDQFEQNVANEAPVVALEGDNRGDLLMPAAYQNSENQPNITGKNCADLGVGFEYYESNPAHGINYPHCGKLENGIYLVSPK